MANIAAGEFGVTVDGVEYVFRPSFRALASLGTPDELAAMLDRVQRATKGGFAAALAALSACCDDESVSDVIGFYRDVGGKLRYVQKRLPWEDVYVLGARCLIYGMVGDTKDAKRIKPSDKPPKQFNPAEFASVAMVHLGLSRDDAWNMTMHELQRAMMVKHPDMVQDLPTKEEYRTAVDTVKRIREKAAQLRSGANG